MKKLLFALVAMLVVGFSAMASPIELKPGVAVAGSQAAGALSEFGTWEMELAPCYSRLAVLLHDAASAVSAKAIDKATALKVLDIADEAKALLDESRRGNAHEPTLQQKHLLEQARFLIEEAEHYLERKP